jgi:Na+/proline symporter
VAHAEFLLSTLDWIVLGVALLGFVAYGNWRGRGSRDLHSYLLAGRSLPWPMVALSVMATQASAVTPSPPGGLRGRAASAVLLGLPLAMVVLCVSASCVPPAEGVHRV